MAWQRSPFKVHIALAFLSLSFFYMDLLSFNFLVRKVVTFFLIESLEIVSCPCGTTEKAESTQFECNQIFFFFVVNFVNFS